MAEAPLCELQDEFTCSVCLDTLTDPVSIPCGHNFCLKCLTDCWDQSQECSCPQCRENVTTRPALRRNNLLNEVIKKLKKTTISPPTLPPTPPPQNYAGPGDVECDFCTGKKFRAVKSCLTCPASYCQTHLQPHYEGDALKHHELVDPDRNLKEKLCEKHQKSLEIFCKTDDSCICMMCVVTGHKHHETVELETEREEKQKQLGATLSDIKTGLEEREKTLKETRRAMEEMKMSVVKEVEENEKSFTALIQCIEEAHRKLTERIREQEKREMEKAKGVMEQLEKEINELKRREAELKELSETKDHLHFLQIFSSCCVLPADGDSLSFTVTAEFSSEDLRKELSGLTKSLEKISQWVIMTRTPSGAPHLKPAAQGRLLGHQRVNLNTSGGAHTGHDTAPRVPRVTAPHSAHPLGNPAILWQRHQRTNAHEAPVFTLQPPEPQSRDDFLKYFCPITVDINTAHRKLHLSEGNKKVTHERTKTEYPDHPDRFDLCVQVLCREALTGTRCYWEVECSGHFMKIGVAYKGLSRKGEGMKCGLGNNDKSWCLECSHSQHSVWHNNQRTVISVPYSPRIGVYLDWPAGSLSFYSVSDTMTLLHRFNTSFTEPLYPGFWVNSTSSVTISHLTPCDH
ncbi:E3 ubiquitin/ISG15 ligase TRIM25-like isoform X1 [Erpetoichthys calabaricus]|uniref:E3 ubiquitin/ISG15 ligase TRIM25-like isoform X1 n=1 Tax=Erpetoichthys calabaricus TaxID=27687 RepID=UPI0022349FDF|nr:E3 ubiquitin/ISG15 ligase TRIM25-like isoform X1 [Erpetoichthys calabaricus]